MTEKPRRPLHFCDPYTSEQYEAFRQSYAFAVRRVCKEPKALAYFDATWPEIQKAADLCGRQLSIWWHLNDKTKWDHRRGKKLPESDTDGARLRGQKANRFRNLRKAASCGDVQQVFEKYPEQIYELLYGALRAGVIEPIAGPDDYSKELIQLRQITANQLKIAVAAASEKGSVLVDNKTRPSKVPVTNYIQFLIETLFAHATNTPSGPASIWVFECALAPFMVQSKDGFKVNLNTYGIRRLVRRVCSTSAPD